MDLDAQIEAILFFKAEPVNFKTLGALLKKSENEIKGALETLNGKLEGRGLMIIEESDTVELRTSSEVSDLIKALTKEEDAKELSKSALETLSIILYKGPIRRRDIDFIRGVNSSFILRTLSIRGLIRKSASTGRENIYESTTDLLSHLGIGSPKDLPEYESTKEVTDDKMADLASKEHEPE